MAKLSVNLTVVVRVALEPFMTPMTVSPWRVSMHCKREKYFRTVERYANLKEC